MDGRCAFEIDVAEPKIGDGRYGPVFAARASGTGEFLTAYKLDLEESAKMAVLNGLPQALQQPHSSSLFSYIGYQRKGNDTYLLARDAPGPTLYDFIHKNPLPPLLVRSILTRVIHALEQLHARGLAAAFLDLKHISLGASGSGVRVEGPLCDVSRSGEALPAAVATLPEVVFGQRNMRKADVWLLGVIALRMLAGKRDLVDAGMASQLGAQVKKGRESAFELLVPEKVKGLDDKLALDFLRQCFIIDIDQRPTISELRNHPFLAAI